MMATAPAGGVYVYYRVASDDAGARSAIGALLAAVDAETGVAGRLMARCDDPATWMEVYEPVADAAAFARRLDDLAQRHRATAITGDGRRHAECFAPLRPLAAQVARGGPDAGAR
jgi:hypothetical protein